ncbi:DUF6875 domain-containing protein [Streptomyces sp. NPDC046557]|uniref:DUF6875 domain-containing protein n=1 Tax=Streptomyces sp. NPDC046557 TaxID=3155372 RepID=UPI0033CD9F67
MPTVPPTTGRRERHNAAVQSQEPETDTTQPSGPWPAPGPPWPLGAPPSGVAHPQACAGIARWAVEYLTLPHAQLGRPGPVCPYVASSLAHNGLHAVVWPGAPRHEHEITSALHTYRNWFTRTSQPPGSPRNRALLILFPELQPQDLSWAIDGVQRLVKTEFVLHGVMIGEFHDGPPSAPGLWNPDFRPLNSPVPMLVLRAMVPSDLPFLTGDPRHLAAYRARFPNVPAHRSVGPPSAAGNGGSQLGRRDQARRSEEVMVSG